QRARVPWRDVGRRRGAGRGGRRAGGAGDLAPSRPGRRVPDQGIRRDDARRLRLARRRGGRRAAPRPRRAMGRRLRVDQADRRHGVPGHHPGARLSSQRPLRARHRGESLKFYLVPLAALAIPLVANPYTQFIVNLMLVYVLVAVGFNLVLGNLGQLAFANTALFGIGAYTAAMLMAHAGWPFWVVIVPA